MRYWYRAKRYAKVWALRVTVVVGLMALGAIIALALLPLFPPVMTDWVNDTQSYVLRLKREVLRYQGEPGSEHTSTIPTPTPQLLATLPTPTPLPSRNLAPHVVTPDPARVLNLDSSPQTATLGELRLYMLGLINEDRQEHGLSPVTLGDNAAAQQQADDKLARGYSSHWGADGMKPYMRYTLAGGYNYEAENSSGPAYLREGLNYQRQSAQELLLESEQGLMQSPGHRRNILNKWHKKVNLGIACNEFTCSVVQQFEGGFIEFSQTPQISKGILSFAGQMKGGFTISGVQVWYDQPPHPLTLGQLDATYSYGVGQEPATFLREPLSGRSYYPESKTTYTWESGLDPYSLDPDMARSHTPPLQTYFQKNKVVPWTTATTWHVSGQSFEIRANLSSVIAALGPGVYTVVIWGNAGGESIALSNYSVFF